MSLFLSTLSLRRATQNARACLNILKFLSTLSLRRATRNIANGKREKDISIHALLAESDYIIGYTINFHIISIHALLAESDSRQATVHTWKKVFLSTLSLRRATVIG